MIEFYNKIDSMFKQVLDAPVPALLIEDNKSILNVLQEVEGEKNFKKDDPKGRIGEDLVKNFLLLQGYTFVKKNKDSKFDLGMLHNNKEVKFEIKVDFLAAKTGNIAIEEETRGKKSGINVWDCDYVVYVLPQTRELMFMKLDQLKRFHADKKAEGIGMLHVSGGDKGSNTHNYLIPKDAFTEFRTVSL